MTSPAARDDAQPTVDFSAVAADHATALHATATDAVAVDTDQDVEDELAADAEDTSFDLGADVAHPSLPHEGPGFDVNRDVAH